MLAPRQGAGQFSARGAPTLPAQALAMPCWPEAMAGKIVDMPEEQFIGALEQQLEALAARVKDALQAGERERDGDSLAGEARRLFASSWGGGPASLAAACLTAGRFPADRAQLVRAARDAKAPPDVVDLIECLPRERYEDLSAALHDLALAIPSGLGAPRHP